MCAEPWDNDSLHDAAEDQQRTYQAVLRDFQTNGCSALAGDYFGPQTHCVRSPDTAHRADVASMLYEILGDDVDGAMSEMSDLW